MGHIWCSVEQPMDAVAAIALHHTVTVRLYVFLDHVSNFAVPCAWPKTKRELKHILRH
jgi:hypothetical protein